MSVCGFAVFVILSRLLTLSGSNWPYPGWSDSLYLSHPHLKLFDSVLSMIFLVLISCWYDGLTAGQSEASKVGVLLPCESHVRLLNHGPLFN